MNTDPVRLGLPSASDTAFWQCPGQWQLKQTIPPTELAKANEPDEFTIMGSKVDKARETGNILELDDPELELLQNGMKYEEMLLRRWVDDLGSEWGGSYQEGPRKERLWENDPETLEPVVSGESDVHYISRPTASHILLIDWKLIGRNVSRAEKNTQLRVLAVLKWRDMDGIKGIRVAINRCGSKVGGTDYVDYLQGDIDRASFWMHQHIWQSRQPDAPLRAGPWCLHCPCKSFCDQAACYSLLPSVIASRAVSGATMDAVEMVAKLTPDDLKKIWQSSALIKKILEATQDRLKSFTDDELRALDLERGKGRETWRVARNAECTAYLLAQGWTQEQVFACVKFSNTELAATMRKEKGLTSDKIATAEMKKELKEFATVDVADAPLKTIKPF